MRSLCVRLHPIIVIVTAEPGLARPLRSGSCSGGKHSVRELALPSKLKWWVGCVAGQNCVADQCHLTDTPAARF
jgi:hypothetical protein